MRFPLASSPGLVNGLNFLLFSVNQDDLVGQLFALFLLTVAAAESAMRLAITAQQQQPVDSTGQAQHPGISAAFDFSTYHYILMCKRAARQTMHLDALWVANHKFWPMLQGLVKGLEPSTT